MVTAEKELPPRLILHFNTYKTTWTCDLDDDKTTAYALQEALADTAWGTLNPKTHEWELTSSDGATLEPDDDSLITYTDYLRTQYPTEGDHLDESTIIEHKRQIRIKTQEFTEKSFGMKLMPLQDQMVRNLTLPKPVLKALGIAKVCLVETDIPETEGDDAGNCARFGRLRIIPSFLNFVTHLVKENRDFQIVFRGFGTGLDDVRKEWNLYCEGEHPCFCGQNKTRKVLLNGQKDSRDLRITDENTGRMDRMTQALEFPSRNSTKVKEGEEDFLMFTPTKFSKSHGIYAGLDEISMEGAVAIQDDYEYWESNEFSADSSKSLYLDQANYKVHHIFFDGTLSVDPNRSTVDVRDAVTGEPIDYDSVIDHELFRVNFVRAITELNYFIDVLPGLEKRFKQRVIRWREEELQRQLEMSIRPPLIDGEEMSAKQYIYTNIIPALAPALEICTRDRPPDPLEFLAFYMLRHKTQYSKSLTILPGTTTSGTVGTTTAPPGTAASGTTAPPGTASGTLPGAGTAPGTEPTSAPTA